MIKKFYFLVLVALCGAGLAKAQQKPQYTQYVLNNYLLNPALSGIENYTDMKVGHRSQWTGLDGAPVTSYFTINAPLGSNFLQGDASAMPSYGGQNPLSRLYTQNYQAAEPHHGIGLMVVNDVTGPINQTNINATYAYHLGLSPTLNLAVGVSAGANYNSLNTSKLTFENDIDPVLRGNTYSRWNPDLGVGAWAYSSTWFAGVSAQQLLTQKLYFSDNTADSKTVPHYFVTAGFKVFLTDEITLLPSTLLKIIEPTPVTFDVNMKLAFSDRLWIGGSYRKGDSFGALLGVNINSIFNVSYSYDYTTSALRTVSNGTHEIVLGILLNNKYKLLSPQHGF
ncbi:hypothetical protein GCM10023149_17120 [Mucilaginibacter gynuensis]|uniref:Type IX secretion system PorP/SprF family membrane protein n=1 Tax=Mucilaginibacter gynuensis TaxID=1302236 RepID=A0ABP8G768_9SPHI